MGPRPHPRRLLTAAAAAGVALATALAGAPGASAAVTPDRFDPSTALGLAKTAGACPPGTSKEKEFTAATGTGAFGDTSCKPDYLEPFSEKSVAAGQAQARVSAPFATAADGAYASALGQKQALTAAGAVTGGGWRPVGSQPVRSDIASYPRVSGLGLNDISGRMEDLVADPANGSHLLGASAGGGLWETTDAAATWHSIGDALPTQVLGASAFIPGGTSGTYVVGTGDPAYGGSSNEGLGIFYSTDKGASWTHAAGSPTAGLTFVIRQKPGTPGTLYAGTSKGLFVSTDRGHSFTNMALPTGCTDLTKPDCFFANMVTDVAVQPGGAVLAAVGWRAGTKKNANGKPQAPKNGLYRSTKGAVAGSYRYIKPSGDGLVGSPGFGRVVGTTNAVGRTTLGVANGIGQNHNLVVAMVEDAVKFNGATGVDQLDSNLPTGVPGNTVLDGLYASSDFGLTWTKIIDSGQLATPDTGTALIGANTPTYAPGIQSWYNQYVEIDPTDASRVIFGLEEVWQTTLTTTTVPATGFSTAAAANTQVIGQYFAGSSCAGLSLGLPLCPLDSRNPAPHSTTHPDQHAGLLVPTGDGGVTLYAGDDGGVYKQTIAGGGTFSQAGWGRGNQGTKAGGFLSTLQPYQAVAAKDGTVYEGLQDNGSIKILGKAEKNTDGSTLPAGTITTTYGGDGFFVAVDPDNANTTWEEYTAGDIRVSTDGGKNWTTKTAGLTSPLFATPFVMDPYDAGHLMIGGRNIAEITGGAAGTFKTVYDLGTRTQPGVAAATAAAGDPNNQMSAVALAGKYAYVGYCGYCDIVTGGLPFGSGIATNVTPDNSAKIGTSNGWHIAAAKGLPKRYVTGIHMDPANPAVVYATLGGYGRRWIPPGSLGDDISKIGSGHLFKSVDGGENFADISGALPDIPANDVLVRNGQLVVATDLGVFQSSDTNGNGFQVLGTGLPNVSVFKLEPIPQFGQKANGPTTSILAASYGRGAYAFDFPTATDGGVTPVVPEAPYAALVPIAALSLLAVVLWRRRRLTGATR